MDHGPVGFAPVHPNFGTAAPTHVLAVQVVIDAHEGDKARAIRLRIQAKTLVAKGDAITNAELKALVRILFKMLRFDD